MTSHETFRLTPGGLAVEGTAQSFESAMDRIFRLQVVGAIVWILVAGLILRGQSLVVMMWLASNYALFDLYLFVRERLSRRRGRSSFARSSKATRFFLDLSPVLMIWTTLFLGAVGTALHVALGL